MRTTMSGMRRALAALLVTLLFAVGAAALDLPGLSAAASAKWGLKASERFTAELTDESITAIARLYGAEKGETLRAKRDAVAALLERYRAGSLLGEDLGTADEHLDKDFRDEVHGFFRRSGVRAAMPAPELRQIQVSAPQLERLSELLQQGKLSENDLAALYDGSAAGSGVAAVRAFPAGQPGAARQPAGIPASKPVPALRASKVPVLGPAAPPASGGKYVRTPMPDIKETGRVNRALGRWDERRRENIEAYKGSEGAHKLKAAAKLSAAAVMQGLLLYSGLPQVETASARLGWDAGHGAPAGVIAADAGKLIFHSAVFVIAMLPIPVIQVSKAALAGNPAAIAFMLAMAVGSVNRFIFHFID